MSDFALAPPSSSWALIDGVSPRWWVLSLWLVVSAFLLFGMPPTGVHDALSTDDAMRLVEVRDLIAGQGWYDLIQHRVMAPEGLPMHWSRLVDAPLAAIILALQPVIGTSTAESVAIGAWPLL